MAPQVSLPLRALAPVATHGVSRITTRTGESPTSVVFPGVANMADHVPADPDIAAGPTAVFEIAEPYFQIFSTSGTPLTSAAPVNTLWSGQPGGPCAQEPTGDWSQVIYDQLAGQFVYARTVHVLGEGQATAYECLAVSETSDPTASWYLYTMPLASGNDDQTDYPQLGFSAEAYYLGTNLWNSPGGTGTFEGDLLVAYNRSELLSGEPLSYATAVLPSSFESFTPTTLEGQTRAPAGSAEMYMGGPSDFLVRDGGQASTLTYFEATPNWETGALLMQGPSTVSIGPYNLDPCPQVPDCAPQPGTSTELEAWTDNLMLPLVYRNFGTYQSIVGTFDVNKSGFPEPEWFELRLNGSGQPQLYQAAVYGPSSASRYDQSIAEDDSGDIVLAYTLSSSTVFPSIAAAAHLSFMAAGAMASQVVLFNGSVSQTASSVGLPPQASPSRWGDASYLALAPDGCTLWFADAYYASTTLPWQTEIVSGKVPGCAGD